MLNKLNFSKNFIGYSLLAVFILALSFFMLDLGWFTPYMNIIYLLIAFVVTLTISIEPLETYQKIKNGTKEDIATFIASLFFITVIVIHAIYMEGTLISPKQGYFENLSIAMSIGGVTAFLVTALNFLLDKKIKNKHSMATIYVSTFIITYAATSFFDVSSLIAMITAAILLRLIILQDRLFKVS